MVVCIIAHKIADIFKKCYKLTTPKTKAQLYQQSQSILSSVFVKDIHSVKLKCLIKIPQKVKRFIFLLKKVHRV